MSTTISPRRYSRHGSTIRQTLKHQSNRWVHFQRGKPRNCSGCHKKRYERFHIPENAHTFCWGRILWSGQTYGERKSSTLLRLYRPCSTTLFACGEKKIGHNAHPCCSFAGVLSARFLPASYHTAARSGNSGESMFQLFAIVVFGHGGAGEKFRPCDTCGGVSLKSPWVRTVPFSTMSVPAGAFHPAHDAVVNMDTSPARCSRR